MSETTPSFVHAYVPARVEGLPTILALHGTGGDERDLLPLVAPWLPGAGILSPRGAVLENGMPRFFRRLAVGVLDAEDMQRRAVELAAFVRESAARYGFDAASVVAAGYSNGANIASAVLMMEPRALAGALLLRPMMLPFVPDPLQSLAGVPIGIVAGTRDELASKADVKRLGDLFQRCGALVSTSWTNGGHALTAHDLETAEQWMLGEWWKRERPGP